MNVPKRIAVFIGLLVGALLLAACGSVRLPQSPLLAQFERKSGLIVFVGLDGNIYTMNQGGEDIVPITEDATEAGANGEANAYYYPVWARDGKKLAYVGFHQAAEGTFETALYTVDNDGSNNAQVHSSEQSAPFYLYWGPNGERISFLSSGGQSGGMQMQLVSVDGDSEAVVVDRAQPFYWAWLPDGKSLLGHTGGASEVNPNGASMWRYDVDSRQTEALRLEPSFFQAPSISADGEKLAAAVVGRSGDAVLIVSNLDGSSQTELTEIDERVAFDWSPKGERLAYISGRSATMGVVGQLKVFDLRNLESPKEIETETEEAIAFFWAPDGDRIAYFAPGIIENDSGDNVLVFQIYVLNARNGDSELIGTIQPPEAFLSQIIPFYDQYQRSATIWSPDGRNLVINAQTGNNRPGIFILPADGSLEPRFVEHGTMAFWSWK